MKAILRKIALMNLILSATETYKHETLGLIFGKLSKNHIDIINAIPYQTAKRKFNEVGDSKKSKILQKFIEKNNKLVGDFHSHSDFKSGMHAELSDQDIKDMKKGMTSLVIGMKKIKKKRKTSVANRKGDGKGLSFSTNGYKYQIRCYYKTKTGLVKELRMSDRNFKRLNFTSWKISKYLNNNKPT